MGYLCTQNLRNGDEKMAKTIFIVVICVALVALSAWMWWFDNCGTTQENKKTEKEKDDSCN